MKIAHIGLKGLPSQGGIERVVEAIVRGLSGHHEFTVYCDRNYTPIDAIIPDVRLFRLPTTKGKHTRMFLLTLTAALDAVLFGDYDLIHIHNPENGFVVPLLRLRYIVISTIHARAYTTEKWGIFARLFMRFSEFLMVYCSNSVTCVTPVIKPYYDRFRRTELITNGVDIEPKVSIESACATLSMYGVTPFKFILFAANRVIPFKGCHLLLEAFRNMEYDGHLLILGQLDKTTEYGQNLCQSTDRRVCFVPFISSQAEVLGLVNQANVFVFPSTNKYGMEGMSMMMLEVVSLGVPLLCSDIPQNKAVLRDYGYYFRSDDAGDLADRLRWAIDHPTKIQGFAQLAQEHIQRNYSWDRVIQQYDATYAQWKTKKSVKQITD